jgi:hypothetical protein
MGQPELTELRDQLVTAKEDISMQDPIPIQGNAQLENVVERVPYKSFKYVQKFQCTA